MDSVPTISDESVNKSPKAKSKKTITKVMNNDKSLQSVAETYLQMQAAPASVVKPSWVPSTIAEEHVNEFVKAVIEARVNGKTVVEFNEKKYLIKEVDPETQAKELAKVTKDLEPTGSAAAAQAENEPEQAPIQNKPEEVKEEDSEEIKLANVADKRAEEEPKIGRAHV